eukprot:6215655-Alexandrium_andersonii.AAC.1
MAAARLRVSSGPARRTRARRHSSMAASCRELLYLPRGNVRPGRREHLATEGRTADLRQARVWTWAEAPRVVAGAQG